MALESEGWTRGRGSMRMEVRQSISAAVPTDVMPVDQPSGHRLPSEPPPEPRSPADLSRRAGIARSPSRVPALVDASTTRLEERLGLRLQAHHPEIHGGLEGL